MYQVRQVSSQVQITTHQPQLGNKSWHINKVSRSGQGSRNHGLVFLVFTFETEQF